MASLLMWSCSQRHFDQSFIKHCHDVIKTNWVNINTFNNTLVTFYYGSVYFLETKRWWWWWWWCQRQHMQWWWWEGVRGGNEGKCRSIIFVHLRLITHIVCPYHTAQTVYQPQYILCLTCWRRTLYPNGCLFFIVPHFVANLLYFFLKQILIYNSYSELSSNFPN